MGSSARSPQKVFSISGQEVVGELQGAKAVTVGLEPALPCTSCRDEQASQGDASCTSNTPSPSSQARMAPQI